QLFTGAALATNIPASRIGFGGIRQRTGVTANTSDTALGVVRPVTSVRAAGFTSTAIGNRKMASFTGMGKYNIGQNWSSEQGQFLIGPQLDSTLGPPLEGKGDETAEEKIKNMEKRVSYLLDNHNSPYDNSY
ncbi:unnamed protein product, partial [Protopolystoma xenopodis]